MRLRRTAYSLVSEGHNLLLLPILSVSPTIFFMRAHFLWSSKELQRTYIVISCDFPYVAETAVFIIVYIFSGERNTYTKILITFERRPVYLVSLRFSKKDLDFLSIPISGDHYMKEQIFFKYFVL